MGINVTVNSGNDIGKISLIQQTRSTIASQNFKPKPNVALIELTDTNITDLQDKQVIQYDSATGKFVANSVTAIAVNVYGGTF
jgi:hypothetical protein